MKMKQDIKGAGVIAVALAGTGLTQMAEAAMVTLNGQPMATSVAPIQRNGRTLVPMRDIFQALGANVSWNSLTQGITATRGGTNIGLQLGNRAATVNGQRVYLEQSPILYNGSTMVPMRFVAEALGAQVNWNPRAEIAAITTQDGRVARYNGGGQGYGGHAVAGARTISVPAGAVVRVRLDNQLSSATARTGDRFTATVLSNSPGDSEFPAGSKLVGVVSDAEQKNGKNPGVLDLDFQSVVMPGGARYPLRGSLTSLDNNNVDRSNPGRIMAKSSGSSKDKLKVIGIGAGAGFLLGKVLKTNSTLTTALGALGGYLYGKKNSDKAREAVLPAGTELAVRLDRNVSYADATGYYDQRSRYFKM